MNRLKQLWGILRSSFWFVPSLIVTVSIFLAVALIGVDFTESEQWLARWPRLFGVGADGARGVLSTIAGSMMTVVGVTIFLRILEALKILADQASGPRRRRALFEQMQQIAELATRSVDSTHDRAKIEAHLMRLRIILNA